ncbi:uncharacterized protein IL334_006780 [Kwoniella shivajii]|uniref:Uncharacterized protein n=1 Tax=Kwoniella shivajii TaxID=564305 RepID=A0ABZ1D6W9_9TREE|nr:hypothetical protein IL334_006780 [Kwoniella shivajii]
MSAPRSIPSIPSLAELQKRSEQFTSSGTSYLPSYSPSLDKLKENFLSSEDLPIPEKSIYSDISTTQSSKLPRSSIGYDIQGHARDQSQSTSWYIEPPPESHENDFDLHHDPIHRAGTSRKLIKSHKGFKPVQEGLPFEKPIPSMVKSRIYAESVSSLTQPCIKDMRENKDETTWLDWITCRICT